MKKLILSLIIASSTDVFAIENEGKEVQSCIESKMRDFYDKNVSGKKIVELAINSCSIEITTFLNACEKQEKTNPKLCQASADILISYGISAYKAYISYDLKLK